jgi:hypothetical protein
VRFETHGDFRNPDVFGCDASAEFLPHGIYESVPRQRPHGNDPGNVVFSYDDVARYFAGRDLVPWTRHPCVVPGWDNSPRQPDGRILALAGASVETYEWWLRRVFERTAQEHPDRTIVFINAWNEWAEGAHLEPDARNGRAHLEATERVLASHGLPEAQPAATRPTTVTAEDRYRDLYEKFIALQREHTAFLQTMERRTRHAVDPLEHELFQARKDVVRLADMLREAQRLARARGEIFPNSSLLERTSARVAAMLGERRRASIRRDPWPRGNGVGTGAEDVPLDRSPNGQHEQ